MGWLAWWVEGRGKAGIAGERYENGVIIPPCPARTCHDFVGGPGRAAGSPRPRVQTVREHHAPHPFTRELNARTGNPSTLHGERHLRDQLVERNRILPH